MRSKEYELLNLKFALLNVRSFINKDEEGLEKLIRFYAKRRKLVFEEEQFAGQFDVSYEDFCGYPCMILRPKEKTLEGAVLYLYGAAYFQAPKESDYRYITELIHDTGYEVWFPLYPLAPDAKISDVMVHVTAVYEAMLLKWESDKIVLQGNSSGACTCLYLLLKIKHDGCTLPYPRCAVLASPAIQMPPSAEQRKRMRPLERTDHVIPVKYCVNFAKLFRKPEYDYLMEPFDQDWSGLPQMLFVYGTYEIFYAYVPDLEKKIKEEHLDVKLLLGQKMMHTYPFQGDTPEGREAKRQIFAFMKRM